MDIATSGGYTPKLIVAPQTWWLEDDPFLLDLKWSLFGGHSFIVLVCIC